MAIMNIAAIHILIKSFCGYLRVLMDCVCLKKLSKIISTTNQRKLNQRWGGSPIVNSAAYCFKAKVHSVFVFGHLQWLLHFVLNAHAHKKVATAPDVTSSHFKVQMQKAGVSAKLAMQESYLFMPFSLCISQSE